MYKIIFRILIFSLIFLTHGFEAFSQKTFEGYIRYKEITKNDTNYFAFRVKNHWVRFEEMDKNKHIRQYTVVNLAKRELFSVKVDERIYRHLTPSTQNFSNTGFELLKSRNSKIIQNKVCSQWIVNETRKKRVTYWVVEGQYDFYIPFLKLLGYKGAAYGDFLRMYENDDYLPIEIVERGWLRQFVRRWEIDVIRPTKISNSLFKIPQGYKLYPN